MPCLTTEELTSLEGHNSTCNKLISAARAKINIWSLGDSLVGKISLDKLATQHTSFQDNMERTKAKDIPYLDGCCDIARNIASLRDINAELDEVISGLSEDGGVWVGKASLRKRIGMRIQHMKNNAEVSGLNIKSFFRAANEKLHKTHKPKPGDPPMGSRFPSRPPDDWVLRPVSPLPHITADSPMGLVWHEEDGGGCEVESEEMSLEHQRSLEDWDATLLQYTDGEPETAKI
jgi:hypothetical protein